MTWSTPQRIPGSAELRIVHESGAVVLRTAHEPVRYLAWSGRRAAVDSAHSSMAVFVGGFETKRAALAAAEQQS